MWVISFVFLEARACNTDRKGLTYINEVKNSVNFGAEITDDLVVECLLPKECQHK